MLADWFTKDKNLKIDSRDNTHVYCILVPKSKMVGTCVSDCMFLDNNFKGKEKKKNCNINSCK